MAANAREKSLETALAQIERQFGKGSLMRLGDEGREPIDVIPSGSIALDLALGIGGYPRGRIIEIYGPESSGKTTLALHAIANVQAAGGIAAIIDAEHALDPEYAKSLGIDLDSLYVSQPDTGEHQSNTTAIFINQLREKIGVMFGSPEVTTGGKALKFYASVRLDIRRIETLKGGTEAVGNRTRVKVVKNKVAPPFKQAEFDILYGVGISREGSLIDMGVEKGIVKKSGAWYTYEGDQLGQGKENARTFLLDNADLCNEIERRLKAELGIGVNLDAPIEVELVEPKPIDA